MSVASLGDGCPPLDNLGSTYNIAYALAVETHTLAVVIHNAVGLSG